ncbi:MULTISPECIES: hypothetical protein [unclassified Duganella]|uniref:hypothetical protein n=1 Tax=unclassified Duganella TaxID=2636909 RepID=UPI0011C1073B|nr:MULTISPECIES: hypothetical protein [unclassified Duganella]
MKRPDVEAATSSHPSCESLSSMRKLVNVIVLWLLCMTVCHAGNSVVSSVCAINEQDLLRSWTRSQGGDFEEFKLAREGGVRSFSSWLHHRPEMMGSWTFKECSLHVFNDSNDKISFDYKVLGLSKGILTLQDRDSGETSVYKSVR